MTDDIRDSAARLCSACPFARYPESMAVLHVALTHANALIAAGDNDIDIDGIVKDVAHLLLVADQTLEELKTERD